MATITSASVSHPATGRDGQVRLFAELRPDVYGQWTPEQLAVLQKAVASVKATAKEAVVEVTAEVPMEVLDVLRTLAEQAAKRKAGPNP